MDDPQPIKRFVRDTLGCTCTDAVFDRIELTPVPGVPPFGRMVVGERLLIYLVQVPDADFARRHLASLVAAGRRDRDACGYNRLRLVLAATQAQAVREAAEALFWTLPERDERVHLHVIEPGGVPDLGAALPPQGE